MIKSMTGFGRGEARCPELGLTAVTEVFSVNRKHLEIKCSLPKELTALEPPVRRAVSERIGRGAVTVRMRLENYSGGEFQSVRVNSAVLNSLAEELIKLTERLSPGSKPDIASLMLVPGVIETGAADPDFDAKIEPAVTASLNAAFESFDKMRTDEAAVIGADLKKRLARLSGMVDAIEPAASGLPAKLRERLLLRLQNAGIGISMDDPSVLRELAIFADKSDVSEEITRLRSHLAQFQAFIEGQDGETKGRNMDFLAQEINREITTLGGKASDTNISPIVVGFKTEMEKIREQIQNLE
jgi:uncharacterized protein (TIGR00255 family)